MKDFAIFILTHGRPDNQYTIHALDKAGYTGRYYLVLDDTDETIQDYIDLYGADKIWIFDKNHYINTSEVGTNNPLYKCILYAKNAVEDIAEHMGLKSFVIADDDIIRFRHRFIEDDKLKSVEACNLDAILEAYNEYLFDTDMTTLGFGNTYVYLGGLKNFDVQTLSSKRIVYNFILRNTAHKVVWSSEMNEDSITPILQSLSGQIWFQLYYVQFDMKACRAGADGGMSDTYKQMGLFKQYAHFLLYTPSSVKLIDRFGSYTHSFSKNATFQKIISDDFKRRQ